MTLRTVVAEHNFLVREALIHVFESAPDVELVAVCLTVDELEAAVAEHHPDIVVTGMHLPPGMAHEGVDAAHALRKLDPRIGVIVIGTEADAAYALSLLEGGSDGRAYLLAERVHSEGQLLSAMRAVARGGSVVDAQVVESFAASHARSDSPLAALRPREHDILVEMAGGASNTAIARSMHMTQRSVEKHVSSIFAKLELPSASDVSRRVQAVLLYLAETDAPVTSTRARPRRGTAVRP